MKTDIPLKRLTILRGADLLPLVALSPLMRNADAPLVETAAKLLLQQASPQEQGDLLSILGVFAEPLVDTQRFVTMVGRERLMSSDLFDYLMKDREAELRGEYESKLQQQEARFRQELQQVLEDTLLIRFPDAPLALIRDIRRVQQPADLHRLIVAVQQVPDLSTAERLLREAGELAEG